MVGTAVEIDWVAPLENGDAITAYDVELLLPGGVTFATAQGSCSGSPALIAAAVTATKCELDLTALRAAPYGHQLAEQVKARVRATNGRGAGAWSA